MFNVTARKFSPPYGDGTFNVIIKNYMDTFSPPYGDGTYGAVSFGLKV